MGYRQPVLPVSYTHLDVYKRQPQSIAVACAATGLVGKESDLFRFTLKHSLFFAVIIGIITYMQAYYLQWMIPLAAR